MSTYDAIIIGANIEGLATAGLLAKAGRHVVVLEASDVLGGLAARRSFHDGFAAPGILHDASRLQRDVVRRLELQNHGLIRRDATTLLVSEGQDDIAVNHDGISGPDAERFNAWRAWIDKVSPVVHSLLDSPAPPLDASLPRLAWPALRLGAKMRKLGRRDMTEFLRVPPMCAADWLDEWFEDDGLKAGIAAPAMEGLWGGPWSAGTAATLLFREVTAGQDVVGGASAVVDALEDCLRANRVEVRTNSRVTSIRCRDDRAVGVTLARGDTVDAAVVASALDPQTTLLDLLGPTDLPPNLVHDISGWRCRGTTAKMHLAIEGPAPFVGDDDRPVDVVRTAGSLDHLERAFDSIKYGEMSERPILDIRAQIERALAEAAAPDAPDPDALLLFQTAAPWLTGDGIELQSIAWQPETGLVASIALRDFATLEQIVADLQSAGFEVDQQDTGVRSGGGVSARLRLGPAGA